MFVNIHDGQVVGESLSTLFSMIQQGPLSAVVTLKNSGVNEMTYRWQQYTGSAWVDLGASGSDYYTTLQPNEVKQILVTSSYPQVQVVGNASGGSFLDFAVGRYVNRGSGQAIPILNL